MESKAGLREARGSAVQGRNGILRLWLAVFATGLSVIPAAAASGRLHPVNTPGPVSAWLCIHSHEAAWTNDHLTWDGRWSDYEGGLQFDSGFQHTYGLDFMRRHHGLGAHAWTPREQMIAANRARIGVDWRGDGWPGPRGFTPWPNTARECGYLR